MSVANAERHSCSHRDAGILRTNCECEARQKGKSADLIKKVVKIGAIIAYSLTLSISRAETMAQSPTNRVAFFKQAMSSPPDIEKFVAKRTNLILPKSDPRLYEYLEGALSGTNFYVHFLPDPGQPADSNHLGTISARVGSSTYELGGHGIVYGVGTNALTEDVRVQFSLTRQILCMGAGEIEPGTMVWNGDDFTAKNVFGKNVHGSLQVSNNLPLRTEFFLAGEQLPYQTIEYTYGTSADSFAGYPASFLINLKSTKGLLPIAEVEFKSVLLATQRLDPSFFSPSRLSGAVTYTNAYSNEVFYASLSKSKRLVRTDLSSLDRSGGFINSKPRLMIYMGFLIATLIPVGILLIWWSQNQKQKQK